MKLILNPIKLAICLVLLTSCTTFLSGQDATDKTDIFLMSPFEVVTTEDVGYLARNTLAGSRLNTELKDTASAISVFTEEFMQDIGAVSIEEVMSYGANITDSTAFQQATVNGNSLSEFDTIFYSRGLPASRARNYFVWEIASDIYNVGRIDQSRGPNSILFGVGSPGGIVNTTTKQAELTRSFGKLKATFGNNNFARAEGDFNHVLVDEKFALRLNLMASTEENWRDFAFNDQERMHIAAKYRPFERTEIRAELEVGEVENIVIRPWGGIDSLSAWLEAGSPILNSANRSQGVTAKGGANFVSYVDNLGYALNMRRTLQTIGTPTNNFTVFLDESLASFETGWEGPGALRYNDYSTYSLFWDQNLLEGLDFQVAFNTQKTDFESYDPQNASHVIRGEPAAALPDGTTTFAGDYYTEVVWENRNREREIDTFRASVSYELDFKNWLDSEGMGKWLGRHRLAGLYEYKDTSNVRSELRPYLEGAPFNRNPENGQNLVRMRHYVTPGDTDGFRAADWRELNDYVYDAGNGNMYPITWYQRNANVDDDEEEQTALMFAMQNYFLDDRLVTTFGYRKDKVDITNRGTRRGDPVAAGKNGQFEVDYDNVSTPTFEAITRTYGLVGHITDTISVFYNESNNTGLPSLNQNVLPNSTTPEPSKGEGQDYGLYLDLFDGRFYVTVAAYETSANGLTAFGTRGAIENRNNRVLDTLVDAGVISSTDADARRVLANVYTFDNVSEGYELTLTANPTNNWRVTLNYSNSELVQSNIAPEVVEWFAENRPLWESNLELSTGNVTIGEEIEDLEEWIAARKQLEGQEAQGSREHSFRIFTRYEFDQGILNGFHVGGGARYISGSAIAAASNGDVIRGDGQTLVDFTTGYRFKLKEEIPVRVQLNIRNLLDEGDPYLTRATTAGVPNRMTLPAARNIRLSIGLDF